MTLRDTPIRRKLMRVILLTSVAVLCCTCVSFFTYEFFTFRSTAVRNLSTLGQIIAANSTASLAFDNPDDAREILSALRAEHHIAVAAIYRLDGRLFAQYPAGLPQSAVPEHPSDVLGLHFTLTSLTLYQPIVQNDRRLGILYLEFDMRQMWESVRLYALIVLIVAAGSLLLAYLLSRVLQQQISRPILALADTARAVSERGDFSVRAVKQGNDEIGLLTEAFNGMLAQIHQRDHALRESEARLQTLNQQLERRVADRTAQLEQANKELEAFSYSVSHDLRAPLRHIDGFAAMLTSHSTAALDEKGRRYVSVISEAARRMGRLIDDLLSFSRHGRAELQFAPIRLNFLVEEVRQQLLGETVGRHITWRIDTLPEVSGDLAMLRQVFANLLGNAIKYTRHRSEAVIEIGTAPADPGFIAVFVRDNGAGFNPKYVERLFGVFQRLHSESEFEGTGVGLANVRRIVQRHGGRTWAEGKVNAGATFYFSLPIRPAPVPVAAASPAALD